MENEFDFFDALQFNRDFTKEGLGGYGTALNIIPPIVDDSEIPIDQATGIETIPGPIEPFIQPNTSQGDGGNGWTAPPNYSLYNDPLDPDNMRGMETKARNDTNIKNLINMGLIDQAKEYVKNNYGYMIMNVIFPGSGIVAKKYIEDKKKKEAKIQKEKDLMAEIQADNLKAAMQAQQAQAVSDADLANIQQIQQHTGQGLSQYRMDRPASERQFTGHGTSGMGRDKSDLMAYGGRIRYGEGGIVTL